MKQKSTFKIKKEYVNYCNCEAITGRKSEYYTDITAISVYESFTSSFEVHKDAVDVRVPFLTSLADGESATTASEVAGMFRRTENTGQFATLDVPMQMRVVKKVAEEAGIGLKGVKITINRQTELLNYGVLGLAKPGHITLFPLAFKDYETLVITLGHERTHVMQFSILGDVLSSEMRDMMETGAEIAEKTHLDYYYHKR